MSIHEKSKQRIISFLKELSNQVEADKVLVKLEVDREPVSVSVLTVDQDPADLVRYKSIVTIEVTPSQKV